MASVRQRQLASEGTSYRELLRDTREQLARSYLQERRYSLIEVSFMLGYLEQSTFTRAFKSWTGQSPGEFRKVGYESPERMVAK